MLTIFNAYFEVFERKIDTLYIACLLTESKNGSAMFWNSI